jgi:uncharacterized protein with von Willebrand factor type A (vWA) domain
MQLVTLELADNGIIKTIVDDNINGAGELFETKTVFDFERHDSIESKIELLYQLSEDIGLDLGNAKQPDQIQITSSWGEKYEPSKKETIEYIKLLEKELEDLKNTLKNSDEH